MGDWLINAGREGNKANHSPETKFLRFLCECITLGNHHLADKTLVGDAIGQELELSGEIMYKKVKLPFPWEVQCWIWGQKPKLTISHIP